MKRPAMSSAFSSPFLSEDAQLKNNTQLPFKEVKSGFTYFEKGDFIS
ncbi:hypothetical protein [Escherichia coli]|nr:hypothetical protein [Escherichia coli]